MFLCGFANQCEMRIKRQNETIIADYLYHRVQSKPQTSTRHSSLYEPVRVESRVILQENEWFVKHDCNVPHLRADSRRLQQETRLYESFGETK